MPTLKLFVSEGAIEQARADRMLERFCEVLSDFETVDPKTIKAGVVVMGPFLNNNPAKKGFLCLEACLLSGRPPELKARMADALKSVLDALAGDDGLSLTVEIREMEREFYRG
mgnify:CR=1 FL=1